MDENSHPPPWGKAERFLRLYVTDYTLSARDLGFARVCSAPPSDIGPSIGPLAGPVFP